VFFLKKLKDYEMRNITRQEHIKNAGIFYNYSTPRKSKYILDHVEPGSKGIDVGAGCGQYAEYLNNLGYEVTALDQNKNLLEGAKCKTVVCSGEKTPFDDNEFDFSMAICILHHCKDPLAVLREMKRISRKVIIQEPNRRNLLVSSFITLTPIRHTEDLNAHYDREGFKDVVKKSGLSIDQFYAQDVFFYPNVYYWAVCS
jgi:ubiquinone/menaquinone biosynthesis C-methylase UbiE